MDAIYFLQGSGSLGGDKLEHSVEDSAFYHELRMV